MFPHLCSIYIHDTNHAFLKILPKVLLASFLSKEYIFILFSLERSFYFLYLFLDNIPPLLRKLLNSSYFRNSSITGTVTFGFCMGSWSVIVSL